MSRVRVSVCILATALACAGSVGAQSLERSLSSPRSSLARTADQPEISRSSAAAKRVALVIGNASYLYVPALDTPLRDTRELCARLKQLRFDTECLENVGTRRRMREAVDRYLDKLTPGSVGVFYFAGHGVQKRGENFLLPVEAQINRIADVDEESLSLGYLMEAAAEARLSLNLVIIDACRENMIPKSLELALPRGFSAIHAPHNTVVFYSTAPGGFALDRGRGALATNSPFARHFLRHIGESGVVLEEFFKRVTAGVLEETAGTQIPWTNSSFTGTFCFGVCPQEAHKEELLRVTNEKHEVEIKLRQLEVERGHREKEVAELVERIRQLEAQTHLRVVEMQGMRDSDRESASRMSEQNRRLQSELEELRQTNERLSEERSRLTVQRLQTKRLEAVSDELSGRIRQVEQLEADNAALRQQTNVLNKELDDARRRMDSRKIGRRTSPPPPAF